MKVVRLTLEDIKSCNAAKVFLLSRKCLPVSILSNFSVLPKLLVFCVLDGFPLFILCPDWPVNVNVVKIGQSSAMYQV